MKLSIVTLCRDNPSELNRTVLSYYKYLSDEIECVVIDGSLKSDCKKLLSQYPLIKYVAQKGSGIYSAMNQGVYMSCGVSVVFMNSGDFFSKELNLKVFVHEYRKILNSHIVFGDVNVFYKGYSRNKVWDKKLKPGLGWLPSHQSVFCPRSKLILVPFDESKSISSDSECLIQLFSILPYIYINTIISHFELGGVSTCPRSLKKVLKHNKEIIETRINMNKKEIFKLYAMQFSKFFVIKLIGFERYLKCCARLK